MVLKCPRLLLTLPNITISVLVVPTHLYIWGIFFFSPLRLGRTPERRFPLDPPWPAPQWAPSSGWQCASAEVNMRWMRLDEVTAGRRKRCGALNVWWQYMTKQHYYIKDFPVRGSASHGVKHRTGAVASPQFIKSFPIFKGKGHMCSPNGQNGPNTLPRESP